MTTSQLPTPDQPTVRTASSAAPDELVSLSATELVAAYRNRVLSPVEVTEAVLARAAARAPSASST